VRKFTNIVSAALLLIYVPTALFLSVTHFHGIASAHDDEVVTVSHSDHHTDFFTEYSDNGCFICHFLNTQLHPDSNPLSNPAYYKSEIADYSTQDTKQSPFRSFEVRGPPYLS